MRVLETIVNWAPYVAAAGFGYWMGGVGGETANIEQSENTIKGAMILSGLAGSVYHSVKWSHRNYEDGDLEGFPIINGIVEGIITGVVTAGAGILGDIIYRV